MNFGDLRAKKFNVETKELMDPYYIKSNEYKTKYNLLLKNLKRLSEYFHDDCSVQLSRDEYNHYIPCIKINNADVVISIGNKFDWQTKRNSYVYYFDTSANSEYKGINAKGVSFKLLLKALKDHFSIGEITLNNV